MTTVSGIPDSPQVEDSQVSGHSQQHQNEHEPNVKSNANQNENSIDIDHDQSNANSNNRNNPTSSPPAHSFRRRLSSQITSFPVNTLERQRSLNNVTNTVSHYIPAGITQHIPGVRGRSGTAAMHETYFCHICFTNYPINEGFTLTRCQHQFCADCISPFFTNKIKNGQVHIKCFYPDQEQKACGVDIDDEDIRRSVSAETWSKRQRFLSNLANNLSRQCPYCDFTQIGDESEPKMTCESCSKMYCLYHSNAHPMEQSCESYDLQMSKENKMNVEAIGPDARPCPGCNYRIQKNGGCNHMKCVNCGCSFCWLCMQEIEDSQLPQHYKDENSSCKGKQFTGMDEEPPPKWVIALLVICICIFCIPSAVLGLFCGICWFPVAYMCDCCNFGDDGSDTTLAQSIGGCFVLWLAIFMFVSILVPLIIILIIYYFLKIIYDLIRLVCPCLPRCPELGQQNAQNANANLNANANAFANQVQNTTANSNTNVNANANVNQNEAERVLSDDLNMNVNRNDNDNRNEDDIEVIVGVSNSNAPN